MAVGHTLGRRFGAPRLPSCSFCWTVGYSLLGTILRGISFCNCRLHTAGSRFLYSPLR